MLVSTSEVSAVLVDTLWCFTGNDKVLSLALRFLPEGRLVGYSHRNERHWRVEDGQLCFISERGHVTGRLSPSVSSDGIVSFHGPSLVDPKVVFTLVGVSWEERGRMASLTRIALASEARAYGWEIGDHSYGRPTVFEKTAKLRIGKYVSIAGGVGIALGNHRVDSVTSYPFPTLRRWWPSAGTPVDHVSKGDVIIGNDVWIGAGAFITSGVTIGDGSVIAGHGVVTKDVPPYAIVGGNPGGILKFRFSQAIIDRLLAVRWWDWPDEKVDRYLPLMFTGEIEDFLGQAEATH